MKVIHLIGGGDVGGAKIHVLSLIKELSKSISVKLISFRSGYFSDDAKKMGIDIDIIKSGNIYKDLKKAIKIIKDGNFDLIHSHGAKANMVAAIVKKFIDIPTITTIHSDYKLDYLHSIPKMFSYGLINKMAIRFIDYYVGVSDNYREMLLKRKFKPESIFTVYNGMSFDELREEYTKEKFCSKYGIGIDKDDIVIGILGRLHPVKDQITFINAANEVLKKNKNIKFLIGGDGPDRKTLENKVKAYGISENVLFLDWVDNPLEFMFNIDIFILTSLSESFPYVVLESARMKKPVISSNVGGIADLIMHGRNGFLFMSRDYMKLSEYISELIEDKNKRMDMGEQIYLKAKNNFSLQNMKDTQLEIYHRIIINQNTVYNRHKDFDIMISGYYGYNNSGDDAMLKGIIQDLKELNNNIKIIVLSKKPQDTINKVGVCSINRINILRIINVLKRTKLFISGGGNLIQDTTSARSLYYYLGLIWIAKKLKKRVMIYANGIGPLKRIINRKITSVILDKTDRITLRDNISLEELDSLKVSRDKVSITADPALVLQPADITTVNKILEKENINTDKKLIGFSIRKYKKHDNTVEIISKIADYIIEEYDAVPVFIPMQRSKDLAILESIEDRMKGKGIIIKTDYGVREILGIISRMELIIGMRLHSIIYATSLGIPSIGLIYEPKVEGYLRYIKQQAYCDIKPLNYNKLKTLLDDVWNKRDIKSKELLSIKNDFINKAKQNALIAIEEIDK
jgi:polysaccharide pyruvyl transferase CsaB